MGITFASLFVAAAFAGADPTPTQTGGPRFLIPSARAGKADLYLIDPATGDAKNLTRTEYDEEITPAWSPDGKKVAFVCKTREHEFEVYVCNADGSGRKMVSTPAEDGPSGCLAPSWSADGTKLAYARSYPGGRWEVRVCSADGSADDLLRAGALSPAWSPDGKQVAFVRKAAGKPPALCVVNPDGTGERVLIDDLGAADLHLPAWSPDGRLVAVGTGTIYGVQLCVVSAAGGPPRQITHLSGFNVNPVWLAPDRLLFAHFPSGGSGGGYATVKADGTRLAVHPLTKMEPPHPLGRPAVFVPRPEARADRDEPNPVRPAAFTAPAAAARPAVKVTPLLLVPPAGPAVAVGAAAWSADGKRLAVGTETGAVLVGEFDGHSLCQVGTFRGHEGPVEGVAFSPDGSHLYSAGMDKSVRTWDVAKQEQLTAETDHEAWVDSVAVSADGKLVASGDRDGVVKVRTAATGKALKEFAACDGKRGSVHGVAFGRGDAVLFAGCGRWDVPFLGGRVAAFDPATGKELWHTTGTCGGVLPLAVSPDGSKVVGACLDTFVRVWDAATGKELGCWKGHADRVTGVAWGLGGKVVVSCGFDHTVRVWDAATGAGLHTLAAHSSPVVRVAATPDGKHVVSTGQIGALFVWKLEE